jgi:serine/threonine protein kinase
MPLDIGSRLGPFRIEAPIGAGGMGEVYRAHDTRLQREVAIKVLPPAVADDPERRDRFDREARAVAALSHPHVCALYDVGQHGETRYLVMEYLDGETLADRLSQRGFLDAPFLETVDPLLEPLRGRPKFEDLMGRVRHDWERFEERVGS